MSLVALIVLSILIYIAALGVGISLICQDLPAALLCLVVALGAVSLIRLITLHHI